MKKCIYVLCLLLSGPMFSGIVLAQGATAHVKHVFINSGSEKHFCTLCGMHLKKFYKTNYIVSLQGKDEKQVCSIHGVSALLKEFPFSHVDAIRVVDFNTQRFIDTQDAYYVLGSNIKGTMSITSKLAFASKNDALAFIKKEGGQLTRFKAALLNADNDFAMDNKRIFKKRSKMMYAKGEMIFKTQCDATKLISLQKEGQQGKHLHVGALKALMIDNNICSAIKGKRLQMAALYYHDKVLTHSPHLQADLSRAIPKDAKCPVCGMFVYKHPHWATWIRVTDSKIHYFDGVKDLVKFYLTPSKYGYDYKAEDFKQIVVLDYFSLQGIDAKQAYFVVGSNVSGPMGAEFIPFENKNEAYQFLVDHRGSGVYLWADLLKSDALH
ncbi:hypothetical protein PCNPT3_12125 [Psychromonas sp. CNPT3]|uniref:nitrous oxide reductase accessory protein NosL n=1 Tax=Psychromonas sp. CNPT3 TaxID=314282 RepID=UPI00006E9E57|nr:nitrous oxide reductase accessory protein NosL [Psychromonas sp. CNPT3]AGH82361.1 hypothetical protein PCNPT3_12125 [Psychromonas sp. CNPT3]